MITICNGVARSIVVGLLAGLLYSSCAKQDDSNIDWFAGEWEGVRIDEIDGHEAPISVQVTKLADGRGQMERLEVRTDKTPYVGFAVRVAEESGKWRMYYGNATRPTISQLEGMLESDRATWISVATSGNRSSKVVMERVDSTQVRRISHISKDNGKTWRVLFTDVLNRSAGNDAQGFVHP